MCRDSTEQMKKIIYNRTKRLFENKKIEYIPTKKVEFIDYIFINCN